MLNVKSYIENRLAGVASVKNENYRIARGAKLYAELASDSIWNHENPEFDFTNYIEGRGWKHYYIPINNVTDKIIIRLIMKLLDIGAFDLFHGYNVVVALGSKKDKNGQLESFNMPSTKEVVKDLDTRLFTYADIPF